MYQNLKFNPSEPFVARTAGRAVVGTCNAIIIGLIANHLRNQRFGTPVGEPTIDAHADTVGEVEGMHADAERRAEQGFALSPEPPLHVAGRIKLIRDDIAKDLEDHAGERVLPMSEKTIKDPFHVGQAIEDTLEFMLTSVQAVNDLVVREEAKALGVTEAEVREALAARPAKQQQFLHQNKAEILEIYKSLIAHDKDGYVLSREQAEATFASGLPAMTRVQLLASADRALFRARQREIQEYVRTGSPINKSNLGLIDGIRRQWRAEIVEWHKDAAFDRDIRAAMERGQRYPEFGPKPAPVEKTEAEKALEQRRAA